MLQLPLKRNLRLVVLNREHSDVIFFFGYVSLSPEERKYSASNKDSAQKLSDVNGRFDTPHTSTTALV